MKRLFAAVKISPGPDFLERFDELQGSLSFEKIKWVEKHNIHVTLKFFGETEESRLPQISAVLASVAGATGRFAFSLKGLGIFGSKYDPRVIWCGIEPYDVLLELMKTLHWELKVIGYEPDHQNLVPHLTLGRIKFLKDKPFFQETIDEFKDLHSGLITIEELILFESILRREGPDYIVLGKYPLVGARL